MTTPMPTPNIPDEVVEAARLARREALRVFSYTSKPYLNPETFALRAALEAALPLLLEHWGFLVDGVPFKGKTSCDKASEPLYRLKVSK